MRAILVILMVILVVLLIAVAVWGFGKVYNQIFELAEIAGDAFRHQMRGKIFP